MTRVCVITYCSSNLRLSVRRLISSKCINSIIAINSDELFVEVIRHSRGKTGSSQLERRTTHVEPVRCCSRNLITRENTKKTTYDDLRIHAIQEAYYIFAEDNWNGAIWTIHHSPQEGVRQKNEDTHRRVHLLRCHYSRTSTLALG